MGEVEVQSAVEEGCGTDERTGDPATALSGRWEEHSSSDIGSRNSEESFALGAIHPGGLMPKVSAEHLEARRNQILDAATTCFARHGIRETTIAHLCAESGLSAGALYRYFNGKEAILDAVYARAMVANRAFGEQIAASDDPLATISHLAAGMVGYVAAPELREAHHLTIQVQAAGLGQPELARGYTRVQHEVVEQVTPLLRALQQEGRVRKEIDVEYVMWVILAAYQGLRTQAMLDPDLDLERFGRALQQVVDHALTRD